MPDTPNIMEGINNHGEWDEPGMWHVWRRRKMPARVFGGENCTINPTLKAKQTAKYNIRMDFKYRRWGRQWLDSSGSGQRLVAVCCVVNRVMNVKIPVIYCLAEEMSPSQRGTPPPNDMAVLHKWEGKKMKFWHFYTITICNSAVPTRSVC